MAHEIKTGGWYYLELIIDSMIMSGTGSLVYPVFAWIINVIGMILAFILGFAGMQAVIPSPIVPWTLGVALSLALFVMVLGGKHVLDLIRRRTTVFGIPKFPMFPNIMGKK